MTRRVVIAPDVAVLLGERHLRRVKERAAVGDFRCAVCNQAIDVDDTISIVARRDPAGGRMIIGGAHGSCSPSRVVAGAPGPPGTVSIAWSAGQLPDGHPVISIFHHVQFMGTEPGGKELDLVRAKFHEVGFVLIDHLGAARPAGIGWSCQVDVAGAVRIVDEAGATVEELDGRPDPRWMDAVRRHGGETLLVEVINVQDRSDHHVEVMRAMADERCYGALVAVTFAEAEATDSG